MNKDILSVIESLSNEKSLDKEIIFNILEKSLEISIKKKINKFFNVKVIFDRNSGTFSVFKLLKVVNKVLDKDKEISLQESIVKLQNLNLNEYVKEKINNFKFNRITSKIAKQIIFYKIREIEKFSLINNFKKLIGKIFTGTIKKIFKNKIILDIGYEFEAVLKKNQMLFNDIYILGKKIKLLLYNVEYNLYGLQLLVSRSHIYMLIKLIKLSINKINKYILNIKYIYRNPGVKSKVVIELKNKEINIYNAYKKINHKINKIFNELNGEKIEFIIWDIDIIKFIENSIFPIKSKYIKLNNDKNIDLFVKKNDLFVILNKKNNLKIVSKLINKSINIITE